MRRPHGKRTRKDGGRRNRENPGSERKEDVRERKDERRGAKNEKRKMRTKRRRGSKEQKKSGGRRAERRRRGKGILEPVKRGEKDEKVPVEGGVVTGGRNRRLTEKRSDRGERRAKESPWDWRERIMRSEVGERREPPHPFVSTGTWNEGVGGGSSISSCIE